MAERAVRNVTERTAVASVQSGLNFKWRYCAVECLCHLRDVRDKMADGKTALEKRFGKHLDGPSIPFRTLVAHIPTTAKNKSRIHQFGHKMLKGFFVCVIRARGVSSGDLMAADCEDFQESEAADIFSTKNLYKRTFTKYRAQTEHSNFLVIVDSGGRS